LARNISSPPRCSRTRRSRSPIGEAMPVCTNEIDQSEMSVESNSTFPPRRTKSLEAVSW
jgi:hypothetical protein